MPTQPLESRATISSLKATHTAHRMAGEILNPPLPVDAIPQPDPRVPIDYAPPVRPTHPPPELEPSPWLQLLWLTWVVYGRQLKMTAIILLITAAIMQILYLVYVR